MMYVIFIKTINLMYMAHNIFLKGLNHGLKNFDLMHIKKKNKNIL